MASIYGELDGCLESFKRVVEKLEGDWKSGEVRLRKGDIERAKKYIKDINTNSRNIKRILQEFEKIV